MPGVVLQSLAFVRKLIYSYWTSIFSDGSFDPIGTDAGHSSMATVTIGKSRPLNLNFSSAKKPKTISKTKLSNLNGTINGSINGSVYGQSRYEEDQLEEEILQAELQMITAKLKVYSARQKLLKRKAAILAERRR